MKRLRTARASLATVALLTILSGLSCSDAGPVGRLEVSPANTRLGFPEAQPLRLTIEPLRELDKAHGPPTVFVHLLHPIEKTVRTFDHVLPDPWKVGVTQSYEIDLYQSALTDPLAPGTYRIGIGLYDQTYGYRWPLETSGEDVDRREYAVATVEVTQTSASPTFEFTGAWLPPEKLDQMQIPVRRCLTGGAALAVTQPSTTAALRLRFFSAAPNRIDNSCTFDPENPTVTAPGSHWLTFPLTSPTCTLHFTPPTVTNPPCLEVLSLQP